MSNVQGRRAISRSLRWAGILVACLAILTSVHGRDGLGSAVAAGTGVNPLPTPPISINPHAVQPVAPTVAPARTPVLLKMVSGGRWAWRLRAPDGRVVAHGVTDVSGWDVLFPGEAGLMLDVPEAGAFGVPVTGATVILVQPIG